MKFPSSQYHESSSLCLRKSIQWKFHAILTASFAKSIHWEKFLLHCGGHELFLLQAFWSENIHFILLLWFLLQKGELIIDLSCWDLFRDSLVLFICLNNLELLLTFKAVTNQGLDIYMKLRRVPIHKNLLPTTFGIPHSPFEQPRTPHCSMNRPILECKLDTPHHGLVTTGWEHIYTRDKNFF